jgi:hypothetical protein
MTKDVLKLALEALEEAHYKVEHKQNAAKREQAIAAIRQALEAPVQRCVLCNYQHGHAIGCKNNPVDIALAKLAQPAPVQEYVILKPEHVIVETYSTQKGGFMLKPDNGVRLTHKPTGTIVQCDSERSQHRNRDQAWRDLERNLSDLGWFCAKCPPSRMNQQ